MRKIFIYFIFSYAMTSSSITGFAQHPENESDKAFNQYKNQFIEQLWQLYPGWATETGYHRYDDLLNVYDNAFRNQIHKYAHRHLDSISRYEKQSLSSLNKMDAAIMKSFLESQLFGVDELKSWQWDPSIYNASGTISFMLSEQYAPLADRLHSINSRLKKIPAYYKVAIQNIKQPSAEHLKLAIEQNTGGFNAFQVAFLDSVKKSDLGSDLKTDMEKNLKNALVAVEEYTSFLKNLKNDNGRSFRLGAELYAKKFNLAIQSRYSYQQIYDFATQRKEFLHAEMEKTARQLWPKYFGTEPMPTDRLKLIRRVIDTLSANHVSPDAFQTTIEKQIPELEKFVVQKKLLYLDQSKPLKVRKEPEYMAGVAVASINAPGPYDKNGNTYYNVSSLHGRDAQQAESYLREYNNYTLQILNIHEAVPGHYTQLVYSNRSPSIIKSILGNGAMIEGWAVYAELMMLENGYGNNKPEMWLMYYKWNLRTVCNTLLDVSVHTKGMTHDQAMDLLINQAFQQKAEAEGKWRRVMLSSVQLTSYYTGFKEICDLREECKELMGSKFNLEKFNEKFLSYGSAPVDLIRHQMISDIQNGKQE